MIRNIGAMITRAAARNADQVSRGTQTAVRSAPPRPPRSTTLNPAGLRTHKPAYLQHNQGGYNNPANQTARYNRKPAILSSISPKAPFQSSVRAPSSVNDTRLSKRSDGSIARFLKSR